MRFLVRLLPKGPDRERFLPSLKVLARPSGVDLRNPKWSSYGALELDAFCPSRADLDILLAAAGPIGSTEFVTDLNRAPEHKSDHELLHEARKLFNSERYWECHEVLEGLWRQKQGEEKRLLQGIILVCAAFVHHQKGEDNVAASVLSRAAAQLEFPASRYHEFDIPGLKKEVLETIESGRFSNFRV